MSKYYVKETRNAEFWCKDPKLLVMHRVFGPAVTRMDILDDMVYKSEHYYTHGIKVKDSYKKSELYSRNSERVDKL